MTGKIFNIQKFSIHDGPGIRTTVFFKGCPLRCKWCSNPESQKAAIEVLHDSERCVQCLRCVKLHPEIGLLSTGKEILIPENVHDFSFVKDCRNKAYTLEGEDKSVEEIVDICLQDIDFYEESGGGVTISGGEGMSQPTFLKELIKQLKEKQIQVAIETTGAVSGDIFQEIAPMLDLILIDVKHYDSKKHREGTGAGNEQILENLAFLKKEGLDFLCRIPVIPEFNDSLEDAQGFSDLFNKMGIDKVQLLPFHQFGEKKYDSLHRDYAYRSFDAYHPEDLKDYQNIFLEAGIDCFF